MSVVITLEEAMDRMKDFDGGDPEMEHCEADDLLCDVLRGLGYGELVEAFDELEKWYA